MVKSMFYGYFEGQTCDSQITLVWEKLIRTKLVGFIGYGIW